MSDAQIAEVSNFLSAPKTLVDEIPEWGKSTRPNEYEASWPIEMESGLIVAGLRFRISGNRQPSISLIYKERPVWRIDFAPAMRCKSNPHNGHQYGLEAEVCGNHEHPWIDANTDYIHKNGFGELPYRRSLPPQIRNFDQAFFDLADRLKISLSHEQRRFNLPPQGELDL